MIDNITEKVSRHSGSYRVGFAGNDLGMPAVPPEIKADYESVKFPVCTDEAFPGYDKISNRAHLFGEIKLGLAVQDGLWQFLARQIWESGELLLQPSGLSECSGLRFPQAQLLPRWEFKPSAVGRHIIYLYWQLKADSAGKLFYLI